jgi:hypothetical protein
MFLSFKPLIAIVGDTNQFISEKCRLTVSLYSNFEP